ncbi:MFS transporter [Litorimonas sp. RW-G-Af-16]|uniref:MFS transporter n=1 Tax=Litorimonas sp. RW-G-Af-16 TaxID=3241168 RepID=UPI00390C691D
MNSLSSRVFRSLTASENGSNVDELPNEPRNFLTHVASLSLTKIADGLIDPKLVLAWLMTAIGAPTALVGLLVPIREAGALLPQLFTAAYIHGLQRRKWLWSLCSIIQGLCALALAFVSAQMTGQSGGLAILAILTILALARSVCSVSIKDVMGKTIANSRRGTATGLASSIAAAGVIIFAVLLMFEIVPRSQLVTGGLTLAGVFWIVSGLIYGSVSEPKSSTRKDAATFKSVLKDLSLLKEDAQLRRFIAVRGLLTATALAPPFMLALATSAGGGTVLNTLGALVLASALAGLISGFIWGKLSDRSSRKVLILAGIVSCVALIVTAFAASLGFINHSFALPGLLFVLMIAYRGVRIGRNTHLMDMATEDTRAAYTALSNTVIGLLLVLGGAFSLLASIAGVVSVIVVMAIMCAVAAVAALGLNEVQNGG